MPPVPVAVQSAPRGVQRIWGGWEGAGRRSDGTGFAGNGSPMNSRASDKPVVPDKRRLVTSVFSVYVIQYSGIGSPGGVGVPPVQFSTTSPSCSAMPSLLTIFGTPEVAVHVGPEMPGANNTQVSFRTPPASLPPKTI